MSSWRESRAAIAALLDEESQSAHDDAPCGYLSLLPDGTIVQLNRTFCEWLSYEADALLGRRLQTILTVGGQIYWETHFAPLLAMQGYISEIAFDLKDRDANVLPVLVSARQRRDADGVVQLWRVVVFNATDRRRYERELLRERKRADDHANAKADLLRMLSHDIRMPLGTIVTIAHLQAAKAQSPTDVKQTQVLRQAAENILALVNKILEAERLEGAPVELRGEAVDLRKHASAVVDELRATAHRKALTITCAVGDRVPPLVLVDEVRLRQVLTNLVANAVKFTAQGAVSVLIDERSRTATRTQLTFEVRDTGIGIPPDRLNAVFEPFAQATADTLREYGGSGLGLTICRRILEAFGSRLEVSSVAGEGSVFHFSLDLPLASDSRDAKVEAARQLN